MRRSQIAFILGACTAVVRIVALAAWNTASKERVKLEPRSRIEPEVLEPLAEVQGEVAGLLDCPAAGRVRGDAAEVHPAGAVLDEHQDVQPVYQHGVDVEKVDGEDSGGLGVQELPPGGAVPARSRIDARGTQDLIDGGRRDRQAQLGELAVDTAVAPERVLPRQADGEPGDAPGCWRAAEPAPSARVVFSRGEPAVPGQ
jgi:hypothetical protein